MVAADLGDSPRRRLALRLTAAGGCGVLLALCFPPYGLALLLPLPIAGLLWLTGQSPPRQAFAAGLAFGFGAMAVGLFWLTRIFGSGAAGLWVIGALWPALLGLGVSLVSASSRRAPSAPATVRTSNTISRLPAWLTAPILWAGLDTVRTQVVWPRFAFLTPGMAALGAPGAVWLAEWLGAAGVTALVVAVAAALSMGKHKPALAAGALAIWLLLWLAPQPPAHARGAFPARLVQAAGEDEDSLFGLSRLPHKAPLAAIVWPEYSFGSDPRMRPQLWARLGELAQEERCILTLGARVDRGDTFSSEALTLGPDGMRLSTHVKNHPVPLFDDGLAGRDANVFPTRGGDVGVAICYDLDSPDVARRLTKNGAEIILAPSDNPWSWGQAERAQQQQIVRMRAAECGRWILGADQAGATFAAGADGRMEAAAASGAPQAVDVTASTSSHVTPYVRCGWLFGWLCLAGTMVVVTTGGVTTPRLSRMAQES